MTKAKALEVITKQKDLLETNAVQVSLSWWTHKTLIYVVQIFSSDSEQYKALKTFEGVNYNQKYYTAHIDQCKELCNIYIECIHEGLMKEQPESKFEKRIWSIVSGIIGGAITVGVQLLMHSLKLFHQ